LPKFIAGDHQEGLIWRRTGKQRRKRKKIKEACGRWGLNTLAPGIGGRCTEKENKLYLMGDSDGMGGYGWVEMKTEK